MQAPDIQLLRNPNETSPQRTIENALESLLPEFEETKMQKARGLLGKTGRKLTDDQLEVVVAQFEYLVGCWLDSYERELFDGKTLKDIIK